jgi:putative ABC transport system substrate-binding protein
LYAGSDASYAQAVFSEALQELGWIEGKNIAFQHRYAHDRTGRLSELAAELVGLNVDIIVTFGALASLYAKMATLTIPIVMIAAGDPVASGLVASLVRPGRNVTGLTMLLTDLTAKQLEILKDALPHATRIGVLWSPTPASRALALKAVETAREKLGVQLDVVPARTVEDFNGAFATMARERIGGLLVVASSLTRAQHTLLAELALKHRLPGMFGTKDYVEAGGLLSYAPDYRHLTREAATYIDKILKGAKPAELAVQQATKFELVINLKTAKALGLTIPQSILLRADEVLE